jgi:Fe-S-cluster containining protein
MVIMQYENVIFPNSVGFHCRKCGVCCRDQPPDINSKEQQRIEAAGYKNFMQNPSDVNNRNIRRNRDGSCFFFTKENTCRINSIKPSICILEPFIITDIDLKTNEIILGLNPLALKECKGISEMESFNVEEIAKAAQSIIRDLSEIIVGKTGFSITDKRVASLTKKHLRKLKSVRR